MTEVVTFGAVILALALVGMFCFSRMRLRTIAIVLAVIALAYVGGIVWFSSALQKALETRHGASAVLEPKGQQDARPVSMRHWMISGPGGGYGFLDIVDEVPRVAGVDAHRAYFTVFFYGGKMYQVPERFRRMAMPSLAVSSVLAVGIMLLVIRAGFRQFRTTRPNQASAGNGAVASRYHSAALRRAVPEIRRWTN